jgi:hypothetical protein
VLITNLWHKDVMHVTGFNHMGGKAIKPSTSSKRILAKISKASFAHKGASNS